MYHTLLFNKDSATCAFEGAQFVRRYRVSHTVEMGWLPTDKSTAVDYQPDSPRNYGVPENIFNAALGT